MATLLEQSALHYPRQSAIKASGINSFWHFLIFLVFHFLYPLRAERQLDTIVCHLDLEFRSHEFIYSMLLVFHKTILTWLLLLRTKSISLVEKWEFVERWILMMTLIVQLNRLVKASHLQLNCWKLGHLYDFFL